MATAGRLAADDEPHSCLSETASNDSALQAARRARRARQEAARATAERKLHAAFRRIQLLEDQVAALRVSNSVAYAMAADKEMRLQLCDLAIGLVEKRRLQRGYSVVKARSFDPILLEETAQETTCADADTAAGRASSDCEGVVDVSEPDEFYNFFSPSTFEAETQTVFSIFNGVGTQTSTSFPDHGLAEAVVDSPTSMIFTGLAQLAVMRTQAHQFVAKQVGESLRTCVDADELDFTSIADQIDLQTFDFRAGESAVEKTTDALSSYSYALAGMLDVSMLADEHANGYGSSEAIKKRRLKANRARKKKVMALERWVKGANITEAREKVKTLSNEDLEMLEMHLALEREIFKPSRRRRRLAWALWLEAAEAVLNERR